MTRNLHEGHRKRLKNRYLTDGLDSFEDHQVLELLLFYAVPRQDTNKLAHRMLQEFGSLANIFEAHPSEICKRCNISEHIGILISLVAPLAKKYEKNKFRKRPTLNSSAKAGEFALSLFTGRKYECFYVICLDIKSKLNYASLVHEGTINEVPVYPRLVVETALMHKAVTVILAHNHPGGTLAPSEGDKEVTMKIKEALRAISIHLADHIIVAGNKYFSFSENGIII